MKQAKIPWPIWDIELIVGFILKSEIEKHLGPHHEYNNTGDGGPGNCWYWCNEYDCGLYILVTSYDTSTNLFSIKSNSNEIKHILSHCGWLVNHQTKINDHLNITQYLNITKNKNGLDIFINPKHYILTSVDDYGSRFIVKNDVRGYAA